MILQIGDQSEDHAYPFTSEVELAGVPAGRLILDLSFTMGDGLGHSLSLVSVSRATSTRFHAVFEAGSASFTFAFTTNDHMVTAPVVVSGQENQARGMGVMLLGDWSDVQLSVGQVLSTSVAVDRGRVAYQGPATGVTRITTANRRLVDEQRIPCTDGDTPTTITSELLPEAAEFSAAELSVPCDDVDILLATSEPEAVLVWEAYQTEEQRTTYDENGTPSTSLVTVTRYRQVSVTIDAEAFAVQSISLPLFYDSRSLDTVQPVDADLISASVARQEDLAGIATLSESLSIEQELTTLEEGYNLRLRPDVANGHLSFSVAVGAGAGPLPEPLAPGDCEGQLRTLFGAGPDGNGRVTLVGGPGVRVIPEPGAHRITLVITDPSGVQ